VEENSQTLTLPSPNPFRDHGGVIGATIATMAERRKIYEVPRKLLEFVFSWPPQLPSEDIDRLRERLSEKTPDLRKTLDCVSGEVQERVRLENDWDFSWKVGRIILGDGKARFPASPPDYVYGDKIVTADLPMAIVALRVSLEWTGLRFVDETSWSKINDFRLLLMDSVSDVMDRSLMELGSECGVIFEEGDGFEIAFLEGNFRMRNVGSGRKGIDRERP
jgi:hypothetical protein